MQDAALERITESGSVEWPWATSAGLAIVTGATGGGGGGSGGGATSLKAGGQTYRAAGGDGGGLADGQTVHGKNGRGCHYGSGGDGGGGATVPRTENQLASDGGSGGKGFPGETLIVELRGLSKGEPLEVEIGQGGGGGGGEGYKEGYAGAVGACGFVLFVPLHVEEKAS